MDSDDIGDSEFHREYLADKARLVVGLTLAEDSYRAALAARDDKAREAIGCGVSITQVAVLTGLTRRVVAKRFAVVD